MQLYLHFKASVSLPDIVEKVPTYVGGDFCVLVNLRYYGALSLLQNRVVAWAEWHAGF